jgi:hypothetical protein
MTRRHADVAYKPGLDNVIQGLHLVAQLVSRLKHEPAAASHSFIDWGIGVKPMA